MSSLIMTTRKHANPRREAGFGLVEVLVSMMILAVGVISFAGLQLRAVQTSGDSYNRTQAMAIAQDLAERVRVNGTQFETYKAAATWSSTAAAPDCMAASCTAADMVTYDVAQIRAAAATLLPEGLVNMQACSGATNGLGCIYVSWDGLQPTAGATGDLHWLHGVYRAPPGDKPAITCVMLEMM
jgi:type IV pilus assembly protein PilV